MGTGVPFQPHSLFLEIVTGHTKRSPIARDVGEPYLPLTVNLPHDFEESFF